MSDDLLAASNDELTAALVHGLTREGRKGWHRADDIMARIVAGELVDALDAAGFVIMQKPPELGGAQIGRGYEKDETPPVGD